MGERKLISKSVLKAILADHKQWLDTEGREGVRADLSNTDLTLVDLSGANLSKADLVLAKISGGEIVRADLSGADLQEALLNGVDLFGANLFKADLFGADLRNANLQETDLRHANLVEADLRSADLRKSNLGKADLNTANLFQADLRGALLEGANFDGAFIIETKINNRNDLINANNIHIQSIEGFLFSKEEERRINEEREERNKRAHGVFVSGESEYLYCLLPCSYGPVQVGRVLFILSFIYEGVRLALTSSFDNMDDLFRRAIFPEVYGTTKDEYRLKIESILAGSIKIKLPGPKELIDAIGEVPRVIEKYRSIRTKEQLKKEQELDLEKKELSIVRKKQEIVENQLKIAEKDQVINIRHEQALLDSATKLSELARANDMPADMIKEINAVIKKTIGEIDQSLERSKIIAEVAARGTAQLAVMRDNLGGGEFKAGEHDLLPALPDDYEISVDTDTED